jgi:F-type H+-transporting ATPase subunit a
MFVSWIVTALLVLGAVLATRRMQLVPTGWQNFFEFTVESLYEMLEGILGSHMMKRSFWFFATIFIYILVANWMGLLPIFGNITYMVQGEHPVPFLRAANSDLNMPLAMATVYFFLWLYWSLTEVGVGGMWTHTFGVKGGLEGIMKYALMPLFFAVGLIEVISILFRQVSLPLRLFGNIFAGENLMEKMGSVFVNMIQTAGSGAQAIGHYLGAAIALIVPLPFYGLEILVGFVQALVFMLLTAVFTAMMCQHEEEH